MVRKRERPLRMKIRTGDTVEIISGKDKGQRGRVQRVLPRENRVVVDGLNLVWKHQKPRLITQKGTKIQMPAPLFASKVMLVCPTAIRRPAWGASAVRTANCTACAKSAAR
jgi:large subunit ribosomal protein L24